MRRALARLACNRSGAAAMEMVIIMPVVAGLMMVALDFSNAWSMRLGLEQAAQSSIELAAARKGVATNYDYLRTAAIDAWGKPFKTAATDSWLECDGVRMASLTVSCNGGQRARYVSVAIAAEYQPVFGWGKVISGTGTSNGILVTGDAVLRVQ
jgi:hypothetical protein